MNVSYRSYLCNVQHSIRMKDFNSTQHASTHSHNFPANCREFATLAMGIVMLLHLRFCALLLQLGVKVITPCGTGILYVVLVLTSETVVPQC